MNWYALEDQLADSRFRSVKSPRNRKPPLNPVLTGLASLSAMSLAKALLQLDKAGIERIQVAVLKFQIS